MLTSLLWVSLISIPDGLCNVIFKIVSKVVDNRLKGVPLEITSEKQSAFVPDRLINDNTITS